MTPSLRPPSGEQFEISHGDQVVTVVEVGGGVRTFTVGGVHVLDGYGIEAMCDGARGQTLVPWPNRVRDGAYDFAGESHQLALTEPEHHNAIHGLLRWRNWAAVEHERDRVTVEARLHPQLGYPFALHVRNSYRLDGEGLTVATTATNIGNEACPFALGFHPYLRAGVDRIDDCRAQIPGATYFPTDERGIPTGRSGVEGTAYDFREPHRLGDTQIDVAYADLDRGGDGRATVRLTAPDGRRSVSLWVDSTFPYVEIFTGDALPDPSKRRRGMGVEPMTGPPNALQTGTDVIVLQPDEATTHTWGLRTEGF